MEKIYNRFKKMIRFINKRKFGYILIIPAILIVIVVLLLPLIISFRTSFYSSILTRPSLGSTFIGFKNYIDLFSDTNFWNSLKISVTSSQCSVICVSDIRGILS